MENDDSKPRKGFARQLARKVLEKASPKFPPVLINDIVSYIKRDTTLTVYSWNFGKKIAGILVQDKSGSSIGYNVTQHRHRQRFTVAHEIGHCLLGHVCSGADYNFKSKDPHEIEANQFAAELLMPSQALKDECKYGINAKELANKFYVSEEAMWLKLMECKLIR